MHLSLLCRPACSQCGRGSSCCRADNLEKPQHLAAVVKCLKEGHVAAHCYDAVEVPDSCNNPSRRAHCIVCVLSKRSVCKQHLCCCSFLESRNAPGVNDSIYSLRLCYVPRAGWTATATLHGASRTSSVAGSSPMAMLRAGATAAVAIAVQAAPTTTVPSIVIAATAASGGMPAADGWPCMHRQLKHARRIYLLVQRQGSFISAGCRRCPSASADFQLYVFIRCTSMWEVARYVDGQS